MNRLISIFLTLILMCGCALFSPLKEPTMTVNEVKIENMGIGSVKVIFVVEVDNPNSRDLEIQSMNYQLVLNDKNFKKMNLADAPVIKKSSKTNVHIPFEFEYRDLFKSLADVLAVKKVRYKIIGEAKVSGFKIPILKEAELSI